jgi:6-pyruvoyl-tetrahydropterin synthase
MHLKCAICVCSMDVICHGQRYVVRIFFTQLLHCDEHTVVFMIHYYTKLKKRIKRKVIKQLESPMYTIGIPAGEWRIADGEDKRIKLYLDEFWKQCNYTFLHYRNTVDYRRTDLSYCLAKYLYIYIQDDLIWYAIFSTPYSLYNYAQNLTSLKYKKQYNYGFCEDPQIREGKGMNSYTL